MKKSLLAFMMSAVLFSLVGCKTAEQKRDIANTTDPYVIPDFNYKLSDIKTSGVTKEQLFSELDPNKIILNSSSICSNRALVWGWNMKRKYNIDSGKIFVFYSRGFFMDPEFTSVAGRSTDPAETTEKQWWYHVAPYVVENGKEIVLDHGFSANRENPILSGGEVTEAWKGPISRPLTMNEWLLRFPKTTQCKEITAEDTDLTDFMRRGQSFPHPTNDSARPEGKEKARCYYRKVPMQYWTPLSVAMKELGKTAKGVVLNPPFSRDSHFEYDILKACEEAVTEDGALKFIGRGGRLQACLRFMGLDQAVPSYANLTSLHPSWDRKLKKRKDKALKSLQSR